MTTRFPLLLTLYFVAWFAALPALSQSKRTFGFGVEVNQHRYKERYTKSDIGGGFLLQVERKVSDHFSIVPTAGFGYPSLFLGVAGRLYVSNRFYVQPGVSAALGAGGNEGIGFGGGANGSVGIAIPARHNQYTDISLRVETLHVTDRSYLIYGVRITYNFGT